MNAPKPVALGYVCGSAGTDVQRQKAAIAAYAAAEGLTLADVLHDESDACTISQLVQAVRQHDAVRVVLPAGFRLAEAHTGIERDLAEHHATCVVLATGGVDPTTLAAPALVGSDSTGVTS